ncbi:MAG: hypothetical protein IPN95_19100 [Bacteroidetes bacterium]|nr:hypothetical protein [Bacteroidota bacterium]
MKIRPETRQKNMPSLDKRVLENVVTVVMILEPFCEYWQYKKVAGKAPSTP